MKGSVSIFDNVNKGNCSSHTTTLKRDESYLESQDWLINEKQLLNQKNEVEKVIEYSLLASSNQEQIHNHPEKISNLKPFTAQYSLEKFNSLQNQKIWKN